MKLSLLPYQQKALQFLLDHPRSALFMDMGLGKTATTLEYLTTLLTNAQARHILVIAPKRVASTTWPQEIQKWSNFSCLRYQTIEGPISGWAPLLSPESLDQRHITLLGAHNTDKFVQLVRDIYPATNPWPFDTIIIDESSMFKSHKSLRFKALSKLAADTNLVSNITLLTGTPAPNGYLDLWSQYKLLDNGERLQHYYTHYVDTYFTRNPYSQFAAPTLKPAALPVINSRISDITVSLQQKDYLDLPPLNYITVPVTPSPKLLHHYHEMRKELVTQIQGGPSTDFLSTTTLSAMTAASAANKLLQLCSGTAYVTPPPLTDLQLIKRKTPPRSSTVSLVTIDTNKLEALDDIVTAATAQGTSLLVFYSYRFERDQILERYSNLTTALDSASDSAGSTDTITRWNNHEIPILLLHPASGGHGLNLQDGGHTVVWYNQTYNLEHWLQGNKRLHRMGQAHPTTVYSLVTSGLLDEHIHRSVLTQKTSTQQAVIDALKAPLGA